MKIRNGFVSNSSSSSFVFGLPKGDFGSMDKMKAAFFPDGGGLYRVWDDTSFPAWEAVQSIIQSAAAYDPSEEIFGWGNEDQEVKEMVKAHPDLEFFEVSYEDHSTFGAAMEHGDFWFNVPCVRISQH